MQKLTRHPAKKIVERAISNEVRQLLHLGVWVMALGLFMIGRTFSSNPALAGIGFMFVGVSIYMLSQWHQLRKVKESPVLDALLKNPRKIVWVYPFITQIMPFGIELFKRSHIIMKLNDGQELSFRIKLKDQKLLLHWLKRLLPHAKFGYSQDKFTRYGQSPESFLNDEWK